MAKALVSDVDCGALIMVIFVGVCDMTGILEAASSRSSDVRGTCWVGEVFALSAVTDDGGVRAWVKPIRAGDECPEPFKDGVPDKKSGKLGVGAGLKDDVSESRSLRFP